MLAARAATAALLALASSAAHAPLAAQATPPVPTSPAPTSPSSTPNPLAVPPSRSIPAVRVILSQEALLPGDRVRVGVRLRDDAHLLVLHADPAGRVRVLFPLDPGDDQRVRGGAERALPARGGRDAFVVGSAIGDGVVLAAVSATPFRVAPFARGGHWDVRVFPRLAPGGDAEGELVGVVDRMTARSARFDYDAAPYRVGEAMPVVTYGGEAYGDSAAQQAASPSAAATYYYDDAFGYGYPFSAGIFPAAVWPGAYAFGFCGGARWRHGLVVMHAGCLAPGSFAHRHRRGRDHRRGHDWGGVATDPNRPPFVGNPDFGEPRPYGVVSTGPRGIASRRRTPGTARRPGALPPSSNGGGGVYRSRPPAGAWSRARRCRSAATACGPATTTAPATT